MLELLSSNHSTSEHSPDEKRLPKSLPYSVLLAGFSLRIETAFVDCRWPSPLLNADVMP
jgi:hypothetical protein